MPDIDLADFGEQPRIEAEIFRASESLEVADASLGSLKARIEEAISEAKTGLSLSARDIGNSQLRFSLDNAQGQVSDIYIRKSDGTVVELGDAIKDPTVESRSITDSIGKAFEAQGVALPDSMISEMRYRVEGDPARTNAVEADSVAKSKAKIQAAGSSLADPSNDGVKTTDEKKAINDKSAKDPTSQKMASDIERIRKDLEDNPSKGSSKVRDFMSGLLKAGLLAGAGFLTYELIDAYRKQLTGCFQSCSDGTKGKVQALTCESEYKNTGSSAVLATVCNSTATSDPSKGPCAAGTGVVPCKCEDCTNPDPTQCGCGATCESDENDSCACSRWCQNGLRVLSAQGKTYDYTCETPSFLDATSNIASNVDSAVSELFGGLTGFLSGLLKYGLWILVGIGALLLLYLGVKFIRGMMDSNKGSGESAKF